MTPTLPRFELPAVFLILVAIEQLLCRELKTARFAAGHEGLVQTCDLLVIVITAGVDREGPIAVGNGVVDVAAGSATLFALAIGIGIDAKIEEVIGTERVIQRSIHARLQFACTFGAAIIQRNGYLPRFDALDGDHHIALARQ